LVEAVKDSKWVNYSLSSSEVVPLAGDVISLLGRILEEDPTVIGDRKKAREADRSRLCQ
jgi:hypothetical protein